MSGDVMEFPRTPEEFCGQYSFFDKDEVYTNGSLLIPVFRVEQMVEHYFERTCELNDSLSRNGGYKCSECSAIFDGYEDDVSYDIVPNYCPSCGARVMKSDQDLAQEVGE